MSEGCVLVDISNINNNNAEIIILELLIPRFKNNNNNYYNHHQHQCNYNIKERKHSLDF